MSGVTLLDRLTFKKNSVLQKQLHVRLQIMKDEYRMTQKYLDKHTSDLTDFLVCVRHTIPGLSSYDQPDTRTMKPCEIASKERFQVENEKRFDERFRRLSTKEAKIEECGREEKLEGSLQEEKKIPEELNYPIASMSSSKHDRGVTDEKFIRRRLQRVMNARNKDIPTDSESKEKPMLNALVLSKRREDQKEKVRPTISRLRPNKRFPREQVHLTTSPSRPNRRFQLGPRYGKNACTKQELEFSEEILRRFEEILQLYDTKQKDIWSRANTATIDSFVAKTGLLETKTTSHPPCPFDNKNPTYCTPSTINSRNFVNRRLIWSAPVRHNPNNVKSYPNNEQQSNSFNKERRASRSRSAYTKVLPRLLCSTFVTSLDEIFEGLEIEPNHHPRLVIKRPKTAPPNYVLKRNSMSASRQQVAGFFADIQSREADTRTILKRSREFQEIVKLLDPTELEEEEDDDDVDSLKDLGQECV